MTEGLRGFNAIITPDRPFCFGQTPGIADLHLITQLNYARRWGADLILYNRLTDIEARCLDIAAFDAARPEDQSDAINSLGTS